ncbi:MAG: HAD-IA family hydrolase [Neisseriaceae bacterium]|nr:MAG: HAD-IA family hydrolase [Neisseriaceae bacterium]
MLQAVLFDLDGTLADTALDLGCALNQLLIHRGLSPLPMDLVRPIASHGTRGLLKLGMNIDESDSEFLQLREAFLAQYETTFTNKTILFPEINPLIKEIIAMELKWGIVTNKPKVFTNRLIDQLGFVYPPQVIVSGDTTSEAKPSTKPMLFACEQLGVDTKNCIYVGDAKRDIEAGKNAGMITVLASWGYLSEKDKEEDWGEDFKINTPLALLPIILQYQY